MHQKPNVHKVEYTNNITSYQQEETLIFDVAFSFDSFFLFVISKFMMVGVPFVRVYLECRLCKNIYFYHIYLYKRDISSTEYILSYNRVILARYSSCIFPLWTRNRLLAGQFPLLRSLNVSAQKRGFDKMVSVYLCTLVR